MEIMKWKDGSDVICQVCGEPVYEGQPVQATISHNPKKRHAEHFLCGGGTMTVIGGGEITVYGGKK